MFYNIFESLCKEKGVTPTKVAHEIGIAQQSVSLWKKRGSTPSGANLQKLADYFGVSVGYLLGEEKEQIIIPGRLSIIEINRKDAKNLQYTIKAADQEAYEIGLKIFSDAGISIAAATPKARLEAAFEKLNDEGQMKAVERIEELTEVSRYLKNP